MEKLLINAFNASSGGGKIIFENYLKSLGELKKYDVYIVSPPNSKYSSQYPEYNFVFVPTLFKNKLLMPFLFIFYLRWLINKLKIKKVLNFSDIPINTDINQIFYFDWAFAVYPEKEIWLKLDFNHKVLLRFKLFFYNLLENKVNLFIVQTDVIKKRMLKYYGNRKIKVIGNSVSVNENKNKKFKLPRETKILLFSAYYKHKNFEILLEVANKMKLKKEKTYFILTLNENLKDSFLFLKKIKKLKLENYFINIGPIEKDNISKIYNSVDFVILPSIIESFSANYIESMFYNKPILTSDRDFSRIICKDAAIYFNPFDSQEIYNKISYLKNNKNLQSKLSKRGKIYSKRFLNWKIISKKINKLI